MIKKWIYSFFLSLFCQAVHAQQSRTTWGIKGGYTMANLWGGSVQDSLSTGGTPSSISGLHLGIGVNSMLKEHFWLKHDLLLVQKGSVLQIDDMRNPVYQSHLKLLYLDAYPCSFTYNLKGFQVFIGPYLGMLLSASMQHKDSSGIMSTNSSIFGTASSSKNYTQRIDAGGVVGMEYEFHCGINLGIRLVYGFVPLIENALIQNGQSKIYNRSLSLSAGYTFGRRKKE
jgi:hypothetical protein